MSDPPGESGILVAAGKPRSRSPGESEDLPDDAHGRPSMLVEGRDAQREVARRQVDAEREAPPAELRVREHMPA